MPEKIIRLCYRKIIDAASATSWEKFVFDDSYMEFLMQAQNYDREKKYALYSELIQQMPAAEKLQGLVSTAVIGYLRQVGGIVPDIRNRLGQLFLPFENFRFEIIQSNTTDKTVHRVAITFYSHPLLWHDTIGDQLVVSVPGRTEKEETLTETVGLHPFLSIYSIKNRF